MVGCAGKQPAYVPGHRFARHDADCMAGIDGELLPFFLRAAGVSFPRRGSGIDAVHLPDDMDWLLRPVLAGLCNYESLKNGALDLADIALMNDAMDVIQENEARAADAMRTK
jgi:hypothetical protein